jgi:tetrahydromethanopterin S-methyltransferase subunit B
MISRETVISKLIEKSGLKLKTVITENHVICLINSPEKLLEKQAELENYRLQYRQEIDPGSEEFWNTYPWEIDEENKVYTKDEVNIILEKLYEANKISEVDLSVFEDMETDRNWSLRVHALERIADKVNLTIDSQHVIWNKYPVYNEFTYRPHLRYLYQTYPCDMTTKTQQRQNDPSTNSSSLDTTDVTNELKLTLFRMKDRIYLTKSILDRYFDLEKLTDYGIVEHFIPLHAASRDESPTLTTLTDRWVYFWKKCNNIWDIGSPTVTDLIDNNSLLLSNKLEEKKEKKNRDDDVNITFSPSHQQERNWCDWINFWFFEPWHLIIFSQPFQDIRDYFGEKTTFYFAWLGCFTYHLLLPSFLGLCLEVLFLVRGYQNGTSIDWPLVAFVVLNIIISVHSMRAWEKEVSVYMHFLRMLGR